MTSSHRVSDDPVELTDTWEEIIAASQDGTYKDKYRVGDTKEIDMGSEGVITMKLVAMDEDDLADGSGKAPMTWVADELLKSGHNMNDEDTSKMGWEASGMRAWLRESVLPLVPEEVRRGIREVTKYSYLCEFQMGVKTTDTIWIPSVREIFLTQEIAGVHIEEEGVSYPEVFKDDASRVRNRPGESDESYAPWWLRSAYSFSFNNDSFDYVRDGKRISAPASEEIGVVVGFCL